MLTNLSRGGAAALFTIIVAAPLRAQSAGALPARARDSSAVVQVMVMSKGRVDTLRMLMRSFEEARPGSLMWDSVRKQIELLMPRVELHRTMSPSMPPRGWIGIVTDGLAQTEEYRPDGVYRTYFAYPTIVTVDGQSPAERAGIMPGDMLVRYNGLDIVGRPFNLTQLLVPDRKLGVTIRRDGETKEFAVTVAKASERVFVRRRDFGGEPGTLQSDLERVATEVRRRIPNGDPASTQFFTAPGFPTGLGNQMFVISPNGVFGASVSTVGPELAKKFKIETGVLVNDVPEGSPASKSGLHAGDVIVSVAGQPVASLSQMRELILARVVERAISLRVVRDKKQQDVNVKW